MVGLRDQDLYSVDRSICSACCQHPLPSGPRLNPVIATRVFSATEQGLAALNKTSENATEKSQLQLTRQFAVRWLSSTDENQARVSPLDQYESRCDEEGVPVFKHTDNDIADRGNLWQPRIGLVGAATGFGLGHQNFDIALKLGIDRWLIRGTTSKNSAAPPCRIDAVGRDLSPIEMEAWLSDLDAMLFVERPVFPGITRIARQMGVSVACVPNWEWLHPGLDWLNDVDVMLCPTHYTTTMMLDWKQRFEFQWEAVHISWPIDLRRFEFRARTNCRRFVYINGSGGATAVITDGSGARLRRKGLDVLLAAARSIPEIPIVVYASPSDVNSLPVNVELRDLPEDNRSLYRDGDVCIQPSHWEGLGLPLLECQAAGMPLITTDAPPMHEHRPLAVIPAELITANLTADLCIPAARIEPENLAAVLKSVYNRPIASQSRQARQFIEREHGWEKAGPKIREHIRNAVNSFGRRPAGER
jgi:hypothetical protein